MAQATFTESLRKVWQQAKNRTPTPDEIIQEFRRINEIITPANDKNETETRGPGYIYSPANRVSNGSFETNLNGWTEAIDAGITATTKRTIEDAYSIEGSLGSLEVEVTAAGTGAAIRHQTITGVSPGEVWSFGCAYRSIALSLAGAIYGYVLIDFRTAADAWISSEGLTLGLSPDWLVVGPGGIENLVAPALTARIRVSLGLLVNPGATGKVRFDQVRAEKAAAVSTRLTRPVWSEWAVEP